MDAFENIWKLFFLIGIPCFKNTKRQTITWWLTLVWLPILYMSLMAVSTFSHIAVTYDFAGFTGVMFAVNIVFRTVYMIRTQNEIELIATTVNSGIADIERLNFVNGKDLRKNNKWILCYGFVTTTAMWSMSFICLIGTIMAASQGYYILVVNAYLPFTYDYEPLNTVVNTLLTLCFFVEVIRQSISDVYFISVIVHLTYYAQALNKFLFKIIKDISANPKHYEINGWFGWWINQHKLTQKVTGLLRSHFSIVFSMYYLYQFIYLESALYLVFMSPTMTSSVKLGYILVATSCTMQLGAYCVLFDMLDKEQLFITSEGYSNWLMLCPLHVQKAFLFLLMRSQKCTKMKAFSIMPYTREHFLNLVKTSFSYFITIYGITRTN